MRICLETRKLSKPSTKIHPTKKEIIIFENNSKPDKKNQFIKKNHLTERKFEDARKVER
jgi:hypothetical protein